MNESIGKEFLERKRFAARQPIRGSDKSWTDLFTRLIIFNSRFTSFFQSTKNAKNIRAHKIATNRDEERVIRNALFFSCLLW